MKIENVNLGGIHGYVQCAEITRWWQRDVDGWMTSTVQAGDRWQDGGNTSDDKKHSERCEFRSLDEDIVGDQQAYIYEMELLIDEDYPEFSPKQTFVQWHDGTYPPAFLRYENGSLQFVLNYDSGLNFRAAMPFRKGVPTRLAFAFMWSPGPNAGNVIVLADGKKVVDERSVSLVERGVKTIHMKAGIYRSGMDRYDGSMPAPAQTVRHRNIRRSVCGIFDVPSKLAGSAAAFQPSKLAPVLGPVAPTPVLATVADTVAVRIARIQAELGVLAKDVGVPSAATLIVQASEKVSKAASQIAKAAGKAA